MSLSVPVPTPSINVSNSDTVYAGTTLNLTCDYTLSSSVDTTPQTAVTWMDDGVAVDTSPGRISTDGATLSFSPLATSDTGNYTCTLTVTTSQTHVTVQEPQQSEVEDVRVQSKILFILPCIPPTNILCISLLVPQPGVDVTLSHTAPLYAGTGLTLTCTVTLDPNVDNSEMVVTDWGDIPEERYSVTDASDSGGTYTGSLTISPLADQDDGTYTCNVTVTGGSNVQQATASDNVTIDVIGKRTLYTACTVTVIPLSTALPAPVVSISPASGSPTAGQTYSLTCSVQVVAQLVVEPSIEWTRQDGTMLNASSDYSLQLNFNPVMTSNGSNYTCSIVIPGVEYVTGQDSRDIIVICKLFMAIYI